MMHKYELWFIARRNGQDVAARYDTKIELLRPTEENILALLFDMEYLDGLFDDNDEAIQPERLMNGNWRVDCGAGVIELRLVQ